MLIQEESKAVEVARYIHLNPVRTGGMGRRLELLRDYPWSSWRIYMGMEPDPGWLERGVIGRAGGGRSRAERRAALKA